MKRLAHLLLIATALFLTTGAALYIDGRSTYAAPSTYTVQDGDTLYGIASGQGIPSGQQADWVSQVVSLNGMSGPDSLSLGQVLKLPGGSGSSSTASSSSSGGSSSAIPVNAVTNNGSSQSTYTVQSGDTLYIIASNLGYADQAAVFSQLVVALNGLSGPDQLSVGQVLKLPVPGGSTTASNTTASTGGTTTTASTQAVVPASTGSAPAASTTSVIKPGTPARSADCQSSAAATCDYGSSDQLIIPSLNTGDSARCGSTAIQASVNVYDVGSDGAMGIPVADCDVVRENFDAFTGYGGYPGSGGTTVLAGHVDYHPHYQAIFWNLRQIQPGTEIDYVNKDGKKITYSVDWAQAITDPNYDWSALAKTGDKESMVLITCDGTFNPDTHEYDRRFVAHATRTN
jgi:LPXTG-site transpeptidase (sortase) family protein